MKILIVELSTSHTEIIEPTVKALKPWTVDLAIHENSLSKVKNLEHQIKIFKLPNTSEVSEAQAIIKKNNYDIIIFNSAQGKNARSLVFKTLFVKSQFVGFHHNPEKLVSSFTQSLIKLKIKKYILLAQFNKDYLVRNGVDSKSLHVFYPVLDQPRAEQNAYQQRIIAIPGVLEQGRRDYFGLIKTVLKNSNEFKNMKFELLGNSLTHDGPEIKKQIMQANLSDRFQLYDGYVEQTTLDHCLKHCDYVMSLMHPGTQYFEKYLHTKISGAYSLAFSFRKPLLLHDLFSKIPDFKENCLFYNLDDLSQQIQKNISLNAKFYDQFDIESQGKKLKEFLNPS